MATSSPPFLNLEYFFNLFYRFIIFIGRWLYDILNDVEHLFWVKVILLAISLFLIIVIAVLVYKLIVLRREEVKNFLSLIKTDNSERGLHNERWEKIEVAMASTNPADWKQAIIDADIMLDEMVKAMNYPGENLGERLKAVEPSDFTSLEDAWAAHKLRNQIAHDSNFTLTHREAKIAISRFRQVFDEFGFL